jgi:sugar lactone lactonase YvrE
VLSAWLDDHGRPRTAFDTLLDLVAEPGVPDGLCVDADGGIWLVMFGAGQLRCYDPSGKLRQKIDLPLRYPTSLAFAGPLLDELVITTARRTPKTSDPSADAGKLIATRPGVRGTR